MTHPYTGQQYQTTRGAAMEAHNTDARARLASTALLAALYASGLRSVFGGKASPWIVPTSLAAGYATQSALRKRFRPYRYSQYATDQGVPVSGGTEFAKVSAFSRPGRADVVHKTAYDLVERVGRVDRDALHMKIARAGGAAYAKWLSDVPTAVKIAALMQGAETQSDDTLRTPDVDISNLVENVSRYVWR